MTEVNRSFDENVYDLNRFGFRSSAGCIGRHDAVARRETRHPGLLGIRCSRRDIVPVFTCHPRRKADRFDR